MRGSERGFEKVLIGQKNGSLMAYRSDWWVALVILKYIDRFSVTENCAFVEDCYRGCRW